MEKNLYSAWGKFLINEIKPRSRKKGCSLQDFMHPVIAFALLRLEIAGYTSRQQTRRVLDAVMLDVYDDETTIIYLAALRLVQADMAEPIITE